MYLQTTTPSLSLISAFMVSWWIMKHDLHHWAVDNNGCLAVGRWIMETERSWSMPEYLMSDMSNLTKVLSASHTFTVAARLTMFDSKSILGDIDPVHAESRAHLRPKLWTAALTSTRLCLLSSDSTPTTYSSSTVAEVALTGFVSLLPCQNFLISAKSCSSVLCFATKFPNLWQSLKLLVVAASTLG